MPRARDGNRQCYQGFGGFGGGLGGLTRGFWAVLRVWGEDLFPVSCADGRRLAWLAGGDDLGEVGDARKTTQYLTEQ